MIFLGSIVSCVLMTASFFLKVNEASLGAPVSLEQVLPPTETITRCALLFFGLPSSYESLVLPSIRQNVLIPNSKYDCDVYAHSVITQEEAEGRSGNGGAIDPNALYLLEESVKAVASNYKHTGRMPHVSGSPLIRKKRFGDSATQQFTSSATPKVLMESLSTSPGKRMPTSFLQAWTTLSNNGTVLSLCGN